MTQEEKKQFENYGFQFLTETGKYAFYKSIDGWGIVWHKCTKEIYDIYATLKDKDGDDGGPIIMGCDDRSLLITETHELEHCLLDEGFVFDDNYVFIFDEDWCNWKNDENRKKHHA